MVVVIALDANAQPVRNLPVRLDIAVNGVIADYGQVSARNVVTRRRRPGHGGLHRAEPAGRPGRHGHGRPDPGHADGDRLRECDHAQRRAFGWCLRASSCRPTGHRRPQFVYSPSAPVSQCRRDLRRDRPAPIPTARSCPTRGTSATEPSASGRLGHAPVPDGGHLTPSASPSPTTAGTRRSTTQSRHRDRERQPDGLVRLLTDEPAAATKTSSSTRRRRGRRPDARS